MPNPCMYMSRKSHFKDASIIWNMCFDGVLIWNKNESVGKRHVTFHTVQKKKENSTNVLLDEFRSIIPDEDICNFTAITIDSWDPRHELMEKILGKGISNCNCQSSTIFSIANNRSITLSCTQTRQGFTNEKLLEAWYKAKQVRILTIWSVSGAVMHAVYPYNPLYHPSQLEIR